MAKEVTVQFNAGGLVIGLLGVAFVVLKLTGHIDWSWWLVTLPFWGGIALFFAIVLVPVIVGLIAVGIALCYEWFQDRKSLRNAKFRRNRKD